MRWEALIEELASAGLSFDDGLSEAELARAEATFGFRFPADLRAFLATALPRGDKLPNWRSGDEAMLRNWLALPLDGILFDVEHNRFWLPEWGPRPEALPEAFARATELVASAPKLIPIYAHRMMPDEPTDAGNPVFSVHQTDIIVYGADLEAYLRTELKLPKTHNERPARAIRFWDVDRFQLRWEL